MVEDQTGWSATTNGTLQTSSYYYPLETLFDRNGATYSYIRHTDAINLDIDMGQSYTFDAITLYQGHPQDDYMLVQLYVLVMMVLPGDQ